VPRNKLMNTPNIFTVIYFYRSGEYYGEYFDEVIASSESEAKEQWDFHYDPKSFRLKFIKRGTAKMQPFLKGNMRLDQVIRRRHVVEVQF
jgi:hypothetical protein